jgi:glycosyltransferase involved in cell wall biosynthesis
MPTPIRVVFVHHAADRFGAGIALVRLVAALGPTVEARAILGAQGRLVDELESAGADVTVLPGGDRVWALAQNLRHDRPDLVHTMSLPAAVYGGAAARLARVPVVWQLHTTLDPAHAAPRLARLARRAARRVPRAVLAESQAVLATLPSVRDARVVPAPVPEPHHLADPRMGRVRAVAMVGRLSPAAGQHVFLEAFAEAFPSPSRTRAVLVGGPRAGEEAYAARLESLARALQIRDRVEFVGQVESVERLLASVDVLVYRLVAPGGSVQVIAEGMSMGIPVVAGDVGASAEMITPEEDGLLVDPGNVADLAFALARLDLDPGLRSRLASAGLRRAQAFSPDRTAQAVLDVYRSVLRR